jgi:hypothetical protein
MNYQRIYNSLIEKRKKIPAKGYTENHHILPRSLGGSDDKSNLVSLTGREHWIAHLLLHKIHRLPQTAFACHMMAMMSEERGIPRIRNSHLYQKIRIECSKNIGQFTSKKGKANSQYGTMWICNLDLKENKKIAKYDEIPEGWIAGRNKWKSLYKTKKCIKCGKDYVGRGSTCSRNCRSKRPCYEETKKKLSSIMKSKNIKHNRSSGKNNPMYGRKYKWINDGLVEKKLFENQTLPEGFSFGRI